MAQVGHGDEEERKARLEKVVATTHLMLAVIKGVVNVGVVLSLKTHSVTLATMLSIQTWCSNNIGTLTWKKYIS